MNIFNWIQGQLNSTERVVSAIAPALVLIAFVLGGLLIYLVRGVLLGQFRDEEMDARNGGALTQVSVRHFFAWLMRPLWRSLVVLSIPPNALTTLSLGLAMGGGVALAMGRFALGGWLYLIAGALDFLDGRVARVTGRSNPAGAALDSILDRYAESAILVGLCWYYRESWVLFACLLALTGSLFVPYVRARGESLGAVMRDVGWFQRPERIIVLGVAVALSPIPEVILVPDDPAPPHRLAILGILILAVSSQWTALQRLMFLLRTLSPEPVQERQAPVWVRYVLGTLVEVAIVAACIWQELVTPVWATLLGSLASGLVLFLFSMNQFRQAPKGQVADELRRFSFLVAANAGLNAGAVALLLLVPSLPVAVVWLVARLTVLATWNYPLLREGAGLTRAWPMQVEAPSSFRVREAHDIS